MEKFLQDIGTYEDSNIVAFGVPIGRSSKTTLSDLRRINWFVESYDMEKRRNLLDGIEVFDMGDLKIAKYSDMSSISDNISKIIGDDKVPLMISGGHLSSLYSIKAFPKKTRIIVFDAHCDLKDQFTDNKMMDLDFVSKDQKLDPKMNDVTWLRRLCEHIDPKDVLLVGIRSCDSDEHAFLEESGINLITPSDIRKDYKKSLDKIREFTNNRDVYISLDIDSFDPSIAPGVDHPEPDGLSFHQFQDTVNVISGNISGMDLCCLKKIEGSEQTEFLAIRSVFEILGKVKR